MLWVLIKDSARLLIHKWRADLYGYTIYSPFQKVFKPVFSPIFSICCTIVLKSYVSQLFSHQLFFLTDVQLERESKNYILEGLQICYG